MGSTGPGSDGPRRQALGDALSGDHHPRHGPRAGRAARSAGDRAALRRGRRLDGRDAGAQPRRQLAQASPNACCASPAPRPCRRRTSPFRRSGARRSWPIPTGRAATTMARQSARCRPVGGADGGAYHLSVGSQPDREVRAAGCRTAQRTRAKTFGFDADFQVESYLRHQGLTLHRALRRQFLSLYHPRNELFRPRRGTWRAAGGCLRGDQSAVLRGQLRQRLALSHRTLARTWRMRSTQRARR